MLRRHFVLKLLAASVLAAPALAGGNRYKFTSFDVPEEDRFMTITEHDDADFSYSKSYLGIARSDDLVMIQITANNTRTVERKKALYRQIVANLSTNPGVRPEDVLINLVEVLPENWSFGNGVAQYATAKS